MRKENPKAALAAVVVVAMIVTALSGCDREEFDHGAEASPALVDGEQAHNTSTRSHQYTMRVAGADVEVSESSTLEVTILPGPDLKINLEFPWTIEFDEIPELGIGAQRLTAEDMHLDEEQASIPLDVVASESGVYQVEGRANFSVCNDDRCDILRNEKVNIEVRAR